MTTSPQEPPNETTRHVVRRLLDDTRALLDRQGLLDRQVQLIKQELHENLREAAITARTLGIRAGL